jgi:hypothetical protein
VGEAWQAAGKGRDEMGRWDAGGRQQEPRGRRRGMEQRRRGAGTRRRSGGMVSCSKAATGETYGACGKMAIQRTAQSRGRAGPDATDRSSLLVSIFAVSVSLPI